jgi:alpha-galactosidase
MTQKEKIEQLIEVVVEHDGETGHPDRLTRAERRFFKKHPDWITKVFTGPKSHVRADEIVRKMRVFDLNEGDVEKVHQVLIDRSVVSKLLDRD